LAHSVDDDDDDVNVDCIQEQLRPMLFLCNRTPYRAVPLTFLYTVLDTSDVQQPLQHNIRFAEQVSRHLTNIGRQITSEWLREAEIIDKDCMSSYNVSLADILRQLPVVGNFTTHTFNVADTYQVSFLAHRTAHAVSSAFDINHTVCPSVCL